MCVVGVERGGCQAKKTKTAVWSIHRKPTRCQLSLAQLINVQFNDLLFFSLQSVSYVFLPSSSTVDCGPTSRDSRHLCPGLCPPVSVLHLHDSLTLFFASFSGVKPNTFFPVSPTLNPLRGSSTTARPPVDSPCKTKAVRSMKVAASVHRHHGNYSVWVLIGSAFKAQLVLNRCCRLDSGPRGKYCLPRN